MTMMIIKHRVPIIAPTTTPTKQRKSYIKETFHKCN